MSFGPSEVRPRGGGDPTPVCIQVRRKELCARSDELVQEKREVTLTSQFLVVLCHCEVDPYFVLCKMYTNFPTHLLLFCADLELFFMVSVAPRHRCG